MPFSPSFAAMWAKAIRFIFFGNYFVGLLAIALSIEFAVQLQLPYCSSLYYVLVFCAPVIYYTYAYTGVLQSASTTNLRSVWYRDHHKLALYSQVTLVAVSTIAGGVYLVTNYDHILHLPLPYWLILLMIILASFLYYGLLPKSLVRINLRNTGWLKAFVIGFVWGSFVSLLPVIALHTEGRDIPVNPLFVSGLFVKNWMFCTMNAIMFDMKDYEDDANKDLRTFAVTIGIHRTIIFVLIPLSVIGMLAMMLLTTYRHFGPIATAINGIPFLLLLYVSWSMHRERDLLYYLIVIDGIVFIKALCGILAMHFVHF